jgi:hypothetical protein
MIRDMLTLALQELELEEAQTHYPSQALINGIAALKAALEESSVLDPAQIILAEREAIYDIVMAAPFNENVDTEPNYEELLFAMKAMAFSITAAIRKRGVLEYPTYTPGVGWRYVSPPKRTWVGLTADEYAELAEEYGPFPINQIEAKLKEKNT